MSEGIPEFFDINSLSHMESEYGIFVSDSGKDQDKLDVLKQLAQSMVQNGVPASTIAEMVDADSFTEIKEKIKDAEKSQQELQQAQQKAEQEAQQQEIQLKQEAMQLEQQNKDKDRQTKIEVAKIAAAAKGRTDSFNLDKTNRDMETKRSQSQIKQQELTEKSRSNQAKEELIREDQRQKSIEKSGDRRENKEERKLKEKDLDIKKQAKNNS